MKVGLGDLTLPTDIFNSGADCYLLFLAVNFPAVAGGQIGFAKKTLTYKKDRITMEAVPVDLLSPQKALGGLPIVVEVAKASAMQTAAANFCKYAPNGGPVAESDTSADYILPAPDDNVSLEK